MTAFPALEGSDTLSLSWWWGLLSFLGVIYTLCWALTIPLPGQLLPHAEQKYRLICHLAYLGPWGLVRWHPNTRNSLCSMAPMLMATYLLLARELATAISDLVEELPAHCRRVGLDCGWRFLPTQTILRFCRLGPMSLLRFSCWCLGHRVLSDPHTSGLPNGNFTQQCCTLHIAMSVPIFVLALLQLLTLVYLYPVLATQPMYFSEAVLLQGCGGKLSRSCCLAAHAAQLRPSCSWISYSCFFLALAEYFILALCSASFCVQLKLWRHLDSLWFLKEGENFGSFRWHISKYKYVCGTGPLGFYFF